MRCTSILLFAMGGALACSGSDRSADSSVQVDSDQPVDARPDVQASDIGADLPFPESGLHKDNRLTVGGRLRTYDFYVPDSAGEEALPVVLLFHGHGGSADDMTGASGKKAPFRMWMPLADREKVIVVYPDGVQSADGKGWNDCRGDATSNPDVDDLLFVDALIDTLSAQLPVDRRRVYASGISNGGHFSLRLAIERSQRVAAVAAVAAAMPAASECGPAQGEVSVLLMNGTEDPLLPYLGGTVSKPADGRGSVLSAAESISFWVEHNKTVATPTTEALADTDPNDKSTIVRHRYTGGKASTEMVLCEVIGGGHAPPSIAEQYTVATVLVIGRQNHDIEMAEEIWAFFKDKTKSP